MERCNQETGGSIWNFLFLYTYGETKKYIRQGVWWGQGRQWTLAFKKD